MGAMDQFLTDNEQSIVNAQRRGIATFGTNPEEDLCYAMQKHVNGAEGDPLFDEFMAQLRDLNRQRNLRDDKVPGPGNQQKDLYYRTADTDGDNKLELSNIMIVDGDRVAIYPPLSGKEKDLPKEFKTVLIDQKMDELRERLVAGVPYFENAAFGNTLWNRNEAIKEAVAGIHPAAREGFIRQSTRTPNALRAAMPSTSTSSSLAEPTAN